MTRAEKQVQRVLDLWRQATAARLTRREAYKMGLIAGTAGLFRSRRLWAASGSDDDIVSPPNTPWQDRLPIPRVEEGVTSPFDTGGKQFQYYNDFPPQRFIDLFEREGQHNFYPAVDGVPSSPIWALDGTFPGPTLDMRYGRPVVLRVRNQLPPSISTPASASRRASFICTTRIPPRRATAALGTGPTPARPPSTTI